MNALCTPEDPIVIGPLVVYRKDSMEPFAEHRAIAEFSSYPIAVLAVKLLRKNEKWLQAAELMMDDEDFLTIQVLARRLKRGVAKEKVRMDFQLFPQAQTGNGQSAKSAPSLGLNDLI